MIITLTTVVIAVICIIIIIIDVIIVVIVRGIMVASIHTSIVVAVGVMGIAAVIFSIVCYRCCYSYHHYCYPHFLHLYTCI